jgi:branched-chain amino acid transport system permease protein
MMSRRFSPALLLALLAVAALAAVPMLAGTFYVQLLTKIMILAVFAMSLDLLVGCTGLVSLGHAAYFGVAAYTLAALSPQYEAANLWLTLPAAMAVSALAALVIGFLVLRASGVYFIMATLAFAQMLYAFFAESGVIGGSDGVYIYSKPEAVLPGGLKPFDLERTTDFYYVSLAAMIGVYLLLRTVLHSLFGRVLVGIRDNEQRMRSLGYATFRYKLAAFVISGALAGLAGYLSAAQFGFVNPELLNWHRSGEVLMMVILGGMGSLFGAALGAFVLVLVQDVLAGLTTHWLLPMGIFIITAVFLLPEGIAGLWRSGFGRRRRAPAAARDPAESADAAATREAAADA